jgi:hypothetical protein
VIYRGSVGGKIKMSRRIGDWLGITILAWVVIVIVVWALSLCWFLYGVYRFFV